MINPLCADSSTHDGAQEPGEGRVRVEHQIYIHHWHHPFDIPVDASVTPTAVSLGPRAPATGERESNWQQDTHW